MVDLMAQPTIILVRHGETNLNKPGMMRGWTDVPLNSSGKEQAKKAAEVVSQDWKLDKLYRADLNRVEQSAKYLEDATGLKAEATKSLRPWNGGNLTGHKVNGLGAKLRFYIEHMSQKPEGGESMKEFIDRLLGFMSNVFDEAEMKKETIGVVTSIRPIEAITGWVENNFNEPINPDKLEAKNEMVGPGGVVRLYLQGKKWKFEVIDKGKVKIGEGQS
jgi:broad specificity phosphatase PhoE